MYPWYVHTFILEFQAGQIFMCGTLEISASETEEFCFAKPNFKPKSTTLLEIDPHIEMISQSQLTYLFTI